MTLSELKKLRVIDFRNMTISESWEYCKQYPPQSHQTMAHLTNDLVNDNQIANFKVKALKNHAECMTIDNYGLTAYVPIGLDIKI